MVQSIIVSMIAVLFQKLVNDEFWNDVKRYVIEAEAVIDAPGTDKAAWVKEQLSSWLESMPERLINFGIEVAVMVLKAKEAG